MGYRGKVNEQTRARELRADGWTYNEIASELHVSKSSVSLWCRDVEVDERRWAARRTEHLLQPWTRRGPNVRSRRKQADIERSLGGGARDRSARSRIASSCGRPGAVRR